MGEVERQLSVLDACERAVDVGVARSAALRRAVLQAAFGGRLVPQDPSDEPASVLLEPIRGRAGCCWTNPSRPSYPTVSIAVMSATMLNQGVYDATEAALLLGRTPAQVVRWASAAGGLEPIVTPSFERAFSFADLVSLRVAAQLNDAGVSDQELRRGLALLRRRYGVDRPLADRAVLRRLATSGSSFIADLDEGWVDIGRGGQGVFDEVAQLYLRRVQFDDAGQPTIWRPAERVVLDPRVQAGAPCIEGTRVPTATISDQLKGESVEDVALDFDLTVEDILAAAAFQESLERGVALAL